MVHGTKDKNRIKKIAQKYGLDLLLLFGSRATETNLEKSDFDVAYLAKKTLDLEKESRLIVDLMPVFKSEIIDLVNIKKASPLLLYAITNSCSVLYESKPLTFASLRVYAFKQYVETKPLYEEKFRRLQEQTKL